MSDRLINSSPDTSRSLLARVRRLEPDAWTRFVKIYGPLIYRWCRQAGLQPNDAADVTQNCFSVLHQKIDRFEDRGDSGSFAGWLRTVTRRQVADFHRERQQRPLAGVSEPADSPAAAEPHDADDEPFDHDERSVLIQRAVLVLKSEFEASTWDAFWRATVQRDKPRDIARDMNLSVAAVWQAKSRVLRRARQELGFFNDAESEENLD